MNNNFEVPSSQLDAPYAKRWELLKPVICRLYIDEKKQVKDIVKIMQLDYKFFASQTQYKRQFGIWNISKALSSRKKERITKVLQTRSREGKNTVVTYNGHDQSKQVRRYLKDQMRQNGAVLPKVSLTIENLSGHALQCGNRLFMNWNTSPAVLVFLKSKAMNYSSPGLLFGTPMSGVEVATPDSDSANSPAHQGSPSSPHNQVVNHEQSNLMLVARKSLLASRTHIFLTGDHMTLLGGMNLQEQIITTDWLHQFWQFSFRTARTWGRGPRLWDAEGLGFERIPVVNTPPPPNTTSFNSRSPSMHSESQVPRYQYRTFGCINKPSSECRWSIHVAPMSYTRIPSPPPDPNLPVDLGDEGTWKRWAEEKSIHDFSETLERNIDSNSFSNIEIKELPLAANQIVRALKRSPEQLLMEAFGFSIMARNIDLVLDMLDELNDNADLRLDNLFPLHLAASYLDGSKTCCLIFDALMTNLTIGEHSVRKIYTNHLNHTVLDTLMISILKAHTSCIPEMVDDAFKKEHRFAGEEVDICGRWDADSDCIRQLQANGSPTIPRNWKHVFCHTSAQTMVHCLSTLFGPHWAPDINTPSGIFLKRCRNETCGLKMQLKPLHTLVVTAVHLAQYGSEGETLFGILACLLCLLSRGANPLLKADISIKALITEDYGQECSHSQLDPLELAQRVPKDLISLWPLARKTGWAILCHVLEQSQKEWGPQTKAALVPYSPVNGVQTLYSDFVGMSDEYNFDNESRFPETNHDSDFDIESDQKESEWEVENGEGLPAYCPEDLERPWHCNYFRKNKYLAPLWAAVQTELLTYRRFKEGDSWISENFNMDSLLQSLDTGSPFVIGLISKNLMKPFCRCGIFDEADDAACVLREEACSEFFSNLEDWEKTTFLNIYEDRFDQWYG